MNTIITIKSECPMQVRTLLGIVLQDLINSPIKDKNLDDGISRKYDCKYGKVDLDMAPEKF